MTKESDHHLAKTLEFVERQMDKLSAKLAARDRELSRANADLAQLRYQVAQLPGCQEPTCKRTAASRCREHEFENLVGLEAEAIRRARWWAAAWRDKARRVEAQRRETAALLF